MFEVLVVLPGFGWIKCYFSVLCLVFLLSLWGFFVGLGEKSCCLFLGVCFCLCPKMGAIIGW